MKDAGIPSGQGCQSGNRFGLNGDGDPHRAEQHEVFRYRNADAKSVPLPNLNQQRCRERVSREVPSLLPSLKARDRSEATDACNSSGFPKVREFCVSPNLVKVVHVSGVPSVALNTRLPLLPSKIPELSLLSKPGSNLRDLVTPYEPVACFVGTRNTRILGHRALAIVADRG